MPIILGYGEDALTLHALSSRLADILRQLNDDSDPARSLIFFRPSFGRKGPGQNGRQSAQFGEFDAIIGTAAAVYLTEAKWKLDGDRHDLELRPEQLLRHRIFRAYLEEHRRQPWRNWADFEPRMKSLLQIEHPCLLPAPADSALARNLAYVVRHLDGCGPKIVDVLMF